jgi:hypothetical protein
MNNLKQQDEKSLYEANYFMKKMQRIGFKDYQLIYNKFGISKKKILNAHFVIKIDNYFSLKVLKHYNKAYSMEFYPNDMDYENTNWFIERDVPIDFYCDVLCELYDDVYFDIDSFYPDNFENTQTFKTFYLYYFDKNKQKCYGLKNNAPLEFIKEKSNFILDLIIKKRDATKPYCNALKP